MKYDIRIGTREETLDTKDTHRVTMLAPDDMPEHPDEKAAVREALQSPIGTKRLKEMVKPGESIVIVTSDITRPCPSWKILPPLLDELHEAGVRNEDITVLFGRGSHRNQTEEEKRHLVSDEIYDRIRCEDSDFENTVHLGVTSRGTPVDLDRRYAEADFRILLGNVEYHYFAGYSGGAKAVMPGMSVPAAIQSNHRFMTDPAACAGKLEGNPVRADIEEAASLCPGDFIVNVVLNAHKEIVYAACGDMTAAHRDACAYLDRFYRRPIDERADIVVVSQGGTPKDLNLYQTQKALDNAKYAVRDGGTIIVCGSCREGFGNARFEEWMTGYDNGKQMTEDIRKHFILGAHKAAAIGAVSMHADIMLVSDMEPETVKKTILKYAPSLQEAYEEASAKYPADASVIIMPYGGSTLPCMKETGNE